MIDQRSVFVSYARADGRDAAMALLTGLAESGVPVWLDSEAIAPGADWDDEIDKALANAAAVLVVVTPGGNVSRQVKSEWNYALAANIPVVPVVVGGCPLPRVLSMLESVDFGQDSRVAIARLASRLASIEADHAEYLRNVLERMKKAQDDSTNPERFDSKLEALASALGRAQGSGDAGAAARASEIEESIVGERLLLSVATSNQDQQEHQRSVGQRLPATSTEFRDRVPQRRRICQLLNDPACRLVSVIGRGGIGKSGLVSLILTDLEEGRWHDTGEAAQIGGIVYLSTRTSGISLDRVLWDVAAVLPKQHRERVTRAWRDQPGTDDVTRIDALLDEVRDRPVIALLDNFEDIQNADGRIIDDSIATFFERVLGRRHQLKLVVTTRTPILLPSNLQGSDNQVEVMEGLPLPDAVAMFRALDVNNETSLFESTDDQLELLAATLHGIPRALEVAASLLMNDPFLTVEDLSADFYNQPEVLDSLVSENLRRLDDDARAVVEALAIFQGPVPIVALESVLHKLDPQVDVKRTVQRLVRSHTLSVERTSRRVSLHPVDRDSALARLRHLSPARVVQLNIESATYFRQLRLPPSEWHSLAAIEPLVQEFHHLCCGGRFDEASDVIELIDRPLLNLWGYFPRILDMRSRLTGLSPRNHVLNEDGLAYVSYALGLYREALHHAEVAHQGASDLGDKILQSAALANLGRSTRYLGETMRATKAHETGAELAKDGGDLTLEAIHLGNLARTLDTSGRPDLAVPYYQRALKIAQKVGDKRGQTYRLGYQGYALFRLAMFDAGLELMEASIKLCYEIDYARGLGIHLTNLARCQMELDDWSEAADALKQSLETNRTIASTSGLAGALSAMADLAAHQCDPSGQRSLIAQALDCATRSGDVLSRAQILLQRARVALDDGDAGTAIHDSQFVVDADIAGTELAALVTLARAQVLGGDEDRSVLTLNRAVESAREQILPDDRRYGVLFDAAVANLLLAKLDPSARSAQDDGARYLCAARELCPLPGPQARVAAALQNDHPAGAMLLKA